METRINTYKNIISMMRNGCGIEVSKLFINIWK